ncbi:sensor histidine kinase [Streptomyces chilikensis]|uniref:sensor histidine kinase n=1 Tax=Streptomyces chilikensis TaxID=1194079 RepID=UPI00140B4227|nr:ATP-binding protein [Streptomyces chilikensis]
MDFATPPVRTPAAWYSWWLMPLALGSGTVASAFLGPEPAVTTPAGAAATAAGAVCVRLLLRSQDRLRRSREEFRAESQEIERRWRQRAAGLESELAAARAQADSRLAAEREALDQRLAERDQAWIATRGRDLAVVARFADQHLPEALKRLRDGEAVEDLLPLVAEERDVTPEVRAELRKVLRTALIGVEEELNRSTSAEQAVISLGNRIHVLTSKLRVRLHEMQGEHGRHPVVAQGLMELDQQIGPADCLAASIGVLGGSARPGRQWQEPQRLLGVVRGGIGRIKDFHRVEVRQLPELGVDGGLVDHLTLIFAHLLDNAARYSPPSEPVIVSGKEVPNGVGIEIQDAGKGLSEEKKREAERSLAGVPAGSGLGGLSEDAHLGLRVVGALARRYGIRVTFADSPWLGTSVVVVVPHKYFSPLAAAPAATASERPAGVPAVPAQSEAEHDTDDAGHTGESTPGGLPRRRSLRRSAAEPREAVRAHAAPQRSAGVPDVPPDASFAGLAAFATAGRDTHAPAPRAAADDRESTEPRTEESDWSA